MRKQYPPFNAIPKSPVAPPPTLFVRKREKIKIYPTVICRYAGFHFIVKYCQEVNIISLLLYLTTLSSSWRRLAG